MNGVLSALLWLIGGYGVAVLLAFSLQSHLLYFPSKDKITTPDKAGLPYKSVKIETEDELLLDAWLIPVTDSKATILFFHGNAGNISHRLDTLLNFYHLGFTSLIVDYRGYGESEGSISEEGTYLDARAAWNYLINQEKTPPDKIITFGRSLGAAVAVNLATTHTPAALIIESGFTSIPDLASDLYPFLPVRLISRFSYDSINHINHIDCPVLIIHSTDDEIIPIEHGKKLYDKANNPKQFLEIKGGHNDGFLINRNHYLKTLDKFISDVITKGRDE